MLDNNGVHPITYAAKTAQKAYKDAEQAFKFELEEPQKVVDYFGLKLVVPNERVWIAADMSGLIHIFLGIEKPFSLAASWHRTQNYKYALLAKIESAPNPDWWKESLIEV